MTRKEEVRSTISAALSPVVVDTGYMKMVQLVCILGRLCYGLTFISEEAELAAVPLAALLVWARHARPCGRHPGDEGRLSARLPLRTRVEPSVGAGPRHRPLDQAAPAG